MKPNEKSKLIKQNNIQINKKVQKQVNKKFQSSFQKNPETYIINMIILIIFLICVVFSIFSILKLLNTKKEPMKILTSLFQQNKEYSSLPSDESTKYSSSLLDEKKICSTNKKFAILRRTSCEACGLFSYYIVHLGCIINYLKHGYIPILDVGSFLNIFTGYNKVMNNPWEEFFNQPCGYTLDKVVKMKDVKIFECECVGDMPDEKTIYSNKIMLDYHHKIQEKYMSIKNNIYKEAKKIWHSLFGGSQNVLGIFIRGTDYSTIEPSGHSRQPSNERIIKDTITMDKKNKYNYIFLGTEDNKIRDLFIKKFGKKLKYLVPKNKIVYDYYYGDYLTYNKNVFGNMNFSKTYLLSVIILSKCIDIISSRTSGAAGVFIISNGYRNKLVYYLGEYSKKDSFKLDYIFKKDLI